MHSRITTILASLVVVAVLSAPMAGPSVVSPVVAQEEIKMTDLGTLGGSYSYARDINDLGQVVGWSYLDPSGIHAFLWDEEEGMTDLSTLGGSSSYAYGINDLGQVVGDSYLDPSGRHAFLWDEEGGMTDLGTLGGSSSYAYGINNLGQVVGDSYLAPSGRATLWTVPLPVVTPGEAIAEAAEQVAALVNDGTLDENEAKGLTSKLEAAQLQLDRENAKVATSVLRAFINQVEAMVNNGRLTVEEAQPLIDAANAAIELIEP